MITTGEDKASSNGEKVRVPKVMRGNPPGPSLGFWVSLRDVLALLDG